MKLLRMNPKIVVTLCFVALFSVQGISAKQVQVKHIEPRSFIDSLVNGANNFFSKLNDSVSQTVNENRHLLHKLVKNITTDEDNAVNQGKKMIDIKVYSEVRKLNMAKAKADKRGITVVECVYGKIHEIQQIGKKGFSNFVGCVTNRVDEALDIVDKASHIVTDTYNKLLSLPPRVKSCASSLSVLFCMPKIIYDMSSYSLSLPKRIANTTSEAIDFYHTLAGKLAVCISVQTLRVGAKAALVTANSLKCIASKII